MTPAHILHAAIMAFCGAACLTGVLLLLTPGPQPNGLRVVADVSAFGFLQGLAFALAWGGLYGVLEFALNSHFTFNVPNIASGCVAGFVTGAAAGLIVGAGTKVRRLMKHQPPTKPNLRWDRITGSVAVGALVGFMSRSATTGTDKVENAIFMGSCFSIIPMLRLVDWWTEQATSRHRILCCMALIIIGVAILTASFWLSTTARS